MLQAIIDKISSKERSTQEDARRRYRELLLSDQAGPAAEAELTRLIETLGKSSDDLRQDYATALRWLQLRATMAAGTGIDAARAQSQEAVQAYALETRKILDERKREHARLYRATNELEQLHSQAQNAINAVNALQKSRADFFGDTPAASINDLA